MIKKPTLKTAIIVMSVTMVILYAFGCRLVFGSVRHIATDAQAIYGGEPVPALITLVQDEEAPFEKRNSAIWALGQIGDERARPALKGLYTNETQAAPYDSTSYIVQHLVEKAVKQTDRFSAMRWMYRWLN
ncbi:MAG: HEAT repeat domain-containing protein, partial [Kiritimatiellaceae bacterium]|nr:HEAT repeat domain-containing protein [Kiritimatiellaceae bacterium]